MPRIPNWLRTVAVLTTTSAVGAGAWLAPGPADARPHGDCVIDAHDAAATIDNLRNHCSSAEIVALFGSADAGLRPPTGKYRLHLLPVQQSPSGLSDYQDAKDFVDLQGRLGDALQFTSGPQGQSWVYKHYISGRDAGAPVQYVPRSFADSRPAWSADFVRDFGGISVSTHEYRQLTPTVWIGRDFLGPGTLAHPPQRGGALALTAY